MTELSGKVTAYETKQGTTNDKDWTSHIVTVGGQKMSSFSKTDVQPLIDAMGSDKTFLVEYEQSGNYKNFKAILATPTQAPAPGGAAPAEAPATSEATAKALAQARELAVFSQRSTNRRTALLTAKDLIVPSLGDPVLIDTIIEQVKTIAEALLPFLEPPTGDNPPAQKGAQQRKADPATTDTPSRSPVAEGGAPDALDASSFWQALADQSYSKKDVVDLVTQGEDVIKFMADHSLTWDTLWMTCMEAFPLEARA